MSICKNLQNWLVFFLILLLQSAPYGGIITTVLQDISKKYLGNKKYKKTEKTANRFYSRKEKSMIKVNVTGGNLSEREKEAYIQRAKTLYPERLISEMDIKVVDNDYVDIEYHYDTAPFQRIRRVTGYLAGTLDRFNNAKKAEVRDRVKHDVTVSDFEDVYLEA